MSTHEFGLEAAIMNGINFRIQEIADHEIRLAQERIKQKIPEIVSSVAIDIGKQISMERSETNLIIRIKIEEK